MPGGDFCGWDFGLGMVACCEFLGVLVGFGVGFGILGVLGLGFGVSVRWVLLGIGVGLGMMLGLVLFFGVVCALRRG